MTHKIEMIHKALRKKGSLRRGIAFMCSTTILVVRFDPHPEKFRMRRRPLPGETTQDLGPIWVQ